MHGAAIWSRQLFWAASVFVAATHASDVLRNGAWDTGANCIAHAYGSDSAFVSTCNSDAPTQRWQLTRDDQLQSDDGKCLEYFDDSNRIAVVACDATRRQKWYLNDGLLKPQGYRRQDGSWFMRVGFCLDASLPQGTLTLHGCHGQRNQKFWATFLATSTRDDVLQSAASWPTDANCVDYDYAQHVAYVYACHGHWNQRWRRSPHDELRVGDNDCLQYDTGSAQVVVRTCTGAVDQQWIVREDNLLQAKSASSSGSPQYVEAPFPSSKLTMAACDASKATQSFTSGSNAITPRVRDLFQVDGPWKQSRNCIDYAWGTELAYLYDCHGLANQLWEFTSDDMIRTADNKCLEFDGDGIEKVMVRTCDSRVSTQKWKTRTTTSREIVPRSYFSSTGAWTTPTGKCLDVALENARLHLWHCNGGETQKFQSSVLPIRNRDWLFADKAGQAGSNCLRGGSSNSVSIATCHASVDTLWEFVPATGELRLESQCLTADVVANKVSMAACAGLASQKWQRTRNNELALQASAVAYDKCLSYTSPTAVTLAKCGSTPSTWSSVIFDGVAPPSLDLTSLYETTNSLSVAVRDDVFLSTSVLTKASAVVSAASTLLASSSASDAQRVAAFLITFLTKNEDTAKPLVKTAVLYWTSESEEFLLLMAMLLQSDSAQVTSVLTAIMPALETFSDQLLAARYNVLLDHVLYNDTRRLEAYTDGSLSDFDQVGGLLGAVCELSSTAKTAKLGMCRLAAYFTLIDQFFVLKYKLVMNGARGITKDTHTQARKVATIFTQFQPQFASDVLWSRLMTLLLFGRAYVDVLPAAMLARASDARVFLPTFVLYAAFGTNPAFVAAVDPMVQFLSDQITTFHVNNILTMVTNQDTAALETYMAEPFGGFQGASGNTSDFPTIARYVAPLVCSDAARLESLSLCRLQEFHSGLQSVLGFERARRSPEVSLVDLLEVDVRKKLDVLDAEKKHFESLTTLQNVANQIGTTIATSMKDLQRQIEANTELIRGDIERARQELRAAIGAVGQSLQDTIVASTEKITRDIGEKAAAIRGDIYESTRQLAERIDDTGRAILGSIEQSKQELKYQIGAEAQQTRALIQAKTQELKSHMSQETQGLREFVDIKTNQVIGVVRDEAKRTRETVDTVAGQIIRTVEREGAITRAFVDTKTNEIKEVVHAESAKTREFVDIKTNQVIKTVKDEAQTTRQFVDEKGNQIIGVVKDEGEQTRKQVRDESKKLHVHLAAQAALLSTVIRVDGQETRKVLIQTAVGLAMHLGTQSPATQQTVANAQQVITDKTTQQADSVVPAAPRRRSTATRAATDIRYLLKGYNTPVCFEMVPEVTWMDTVPQPYSTAAVSVCFYTELLMMYFSLLHDPP